MQKEYIKPIFQTALKKIGLEKEIDINFEIPKNTDHGDFSTNVAMQLARELKKAPRQIAEDIIENLEYDKNMVADVNIAGPGFINIKFNENFYQSALETVLKIGNNYGKSEKGNNKKVNVEYVSVNPTGLLHLGHGRNAAIGDTVANLYEWMGYDVTREYYFNNAGNQMNNLAKSIHARYCQATIDPEFTFPEDGYHGEYVKEIANEFIEKHGKDFSEASEENLFKFRKYGEEWAFDKIKKTLNRMNIHQDVYFNEDSLYKEGKIEQIINDYKEKDLAYEKDNALWLKLSELGLDDDRVIVKSTGEPTYRLPDMAYHREKLERGFDIIVDLFGADHIATYPDVLAGLKALGYDVDKIKVLIHQFVTLTENGQQVKMSKRSGKSYTLDDLLDEVGEDVVRFFLLMRSNTTHLEFDLGLAREQSDKNPVYYLQYAHARICSIFAQAQEREITISDNVDLSILQHDSEVNLIKNIIQFPKVIEHACNKSEGHVVADYLRELAAAFHLFYHHCRILGEEENIMQARFKLISTARTVLKNGLSILGITAPEKM